MPIRYYVTGSQFAMALRPGPPSPGRSYCRGVTPAIRYWESSLLELDHDHDECCSGGSRARAAAAQAHWQAVAASVISGSAGGQGPVITLALPPPRTGSRYWPGEALRPAIPSRYWELLLRVACDSGWGGGLPPLRLSMSLSPAKNGFEFG